MINNVFSITSSDGKITQTPSGEFTATSTLPSDAVTLVKGTSDFVPINDGLPGFISNQNITRPLIYIEENGEPRKIRINGGMSAFLGNGPIPLAGSTIYGYIISFDTKHHPFDDSSNTESCYVINFITNPSYKLPEPTYEGWGLTDISWTANNKLWHGYDIEGFVSSGIQGRLSYGPILWNAYLGNYPHLLVAFITVLNGALTVSSMNISDGSSGATFQGTQNESFVNLYSPRKITILNSDIIIPSLEDRVSKLESEMAKIPTETKQALAEAVEEVSKLYVAR